MKESRQIVTLSKQLGNDQIIEHEFITDEYAQGGKEYSIISRTLSAKTREQISRKFERVTKDKGNSIYQYLLAHGYDIVRLDKFTPTKMDMR